MGLTTSLSHALTGLRSIETGLETVSRNIANAGVDGYARRRVMPVELASGGVISANVQRELDAVVQRHLRAETGAAAEASVTATYLSRLDASFGVPGSDTSLDTLFNRFTAEIETLAAEPANHTARLSVTGAAQALAGGLNRLSADVESLRSDAESGIGGAVSEANAALRTLEASERELAFSRFGNARADILDVRDRALDTLSRLMDIRVAPRGDGAISVYTSGGAALFTGKASRIEFDPQGPLIAGRTGGDLKLISAEGGETELSAASLRSGEIAGSLALRDHRLPAIGAGLDSLAAGLARASDESGVSIFADAGNGTAIAPFAGGAQELGFAGRIAIHPTLTSNPATLSPGGDPQRARALAQALQDTPRAFVTVEAGRPAFTGDVGSAIRHALDRQGAMASDAGRLSEGQAVVLNGLRERFSEVSGVSVDQEMAQLVELQNAYAANARIISAVQDMYDALLRI